MAKDGSDLLVRALRRAHTDMNQKEDEPTSPDPPADYGQESERPTESTGASARA